ncbi:hypothetical protein [Qipengyuania sediminis]|uniref:hypothetical protein n=1 Tax=Qipengyuania sediminis TaxID=1532023 RepID=UPI0010597AB2|nr:hypothetical protein [Qipengyuania sediminis]
MSGTGCAANDFDDELSIGRTRPDQLRDLQRALTAVLSAADAMQLSRVALHIDHANAILSDEIAKSIESS